jgi:cell division protein FtsB
VAAVTTRAPSRGATRPRAAGSGPGPRARRSARGGSTGGRGGRARRPRRRLPRADRTLIAVLVSSIVVGLLILAGPMELRLAARDRVTTLEAQLAALDAENVRLTERRDDLRDPEVVELLAREQQGLVRPGEVPYVLTPPPVDRPRIVDPVPVADAPEPDLAARIIAWLRALAD